MDRIYFYVTYKIISITFLSLLSYACDKESYYQRVPKPDYWPTQEWKFTSPEAQGLASGELVKALDYILETQLNIHNLLIIRHGYIVLDAAFYPYPGNEKHNIASVTKSVMATLIGQAIDRGLIKSIDEPVFTLLENFKPQWGDDKKEVNLKHLITMSSGFDCGYENGEAELIEMLAEYDWVEYILALPMKHKPGQRFAYCSGNSHLLSALIQSASRSQTKAFAEEYLFAPLGIKDYFWPDDPQGVTRGWGDLQLRPKDMAKIGFLYLHGGLWDDRQIVSEKWIKQAATPQVKIPNSKQYYGYGWWLYEEAPLKLYVARGRGGQRIAVWPEQNMVIVTTGADANSDKLITFITNAIKSPKAIVENPVEFERLKQKIAAKGEASQPQLAKTLPSMAERISGNRYSIDSNPMHLSEFGIKFDQDNAWVEVVVDNKFFNLPIGLDGKYRITSTGPNYANVGMKGEWTTK